MSLKWEPTPFKAPLARARGLGAAHSGVHHWLHQRITALANIPLALWAVWSVVTLAAAGPSYDAVTMFFREPSHAILMILFLLSVFYHAALGLQIVIEDYIHREASKMVALVAMRLTFVAMAVASLFAIVKLGLSPLTVSVIAG